MSAPQLDQTVPALGALALVVGPSGAGKDTLIDYARDCLARDRRFVFVRRVITRPSGAADAFELHDAMDDAQFIAARDRGAFALSWQSHGLRYGIRAEDVRRTAEGLVLIANVSRAVIPDAMRLCERLLVVHVTAPPEILAHRLRSRGRETASDIAARLSRAVHMDVAGARLVEIDNSGAIADAGDRLVASLRDLLDPAAWREPSSS